MNSGNSFQANTIDGVSSETDIFNYWKDHFYKLLNTNYCDTILKSSIMSKLDNVQYSNDMIISIKLIQAAVGNLECGKSAGPDGIFAKSIKFAHHRIHVLLSLCFSLCLTHGYTQETIEALGGMDIMPKHSDICRCRYVCIFKLSFR